MVEAVEKCGLVMPVRMSADQTLAGWSMVDESMIRWMNKQPGGGNNPSGDLQALAAQIAESEARAQERMDMLDAVLPLQHHCFREDNEAHDGGISTIAIRSRPRTSLPLSTTPLPRHAPRQPQR